MRDPEFWDRKDVREWLESAAADMLPKMKESALSLAIFGGKVDAKLCMEIGAAVLLDKPIVLLVTKDERVSQALERAAAAIVRGNPEFGSQRSNNGGYRKGIAAQCVREESMTSMTSLWINYVAIALLLIALVVNVMFVRAKWRAQSGEVRANPPAAGVIPTSSIFHKPANAPCPPGTELRPKLFTEKDGSTNDGCYNPNGDGSIDYLNPGESARLPAFRVEQDGGTT